MSHVPFLPLGCACVLGSWVAWVPGRLRGGGELFFRRGVLWASPGRKKSCFLPGLRNELCVFGNTDESARESDYVWQELGSGCFPSMVGLGRRPARSALASRARDDTRQVLCPAINPHHSRDVGTREGEEPAEGRPAKLQGSRVGPQTCCCREPDSPALVSRRRAGATLPAARASLCPPDQRNWDFRNWVTTFPSQGESRVVLMMPVGACSRGPTQVPRTSECPDLWGQ